MIAGVEEAGGVAILKADLWLVNTVSIRVNGSGDVIESFGGGVYIWRGWWGMLLLGWSR